mgnify:CR=1 FL=1
MNAVKRTIKSTPSSNSNSAKISRERPGNKKKGLWVTTLTRNLHARANTEIEQQRDQFDDAVSVSA